MDISFFGHFQGPFDIQAWIESWRTFCLRSAESILLILFEEAGCGDRVQFSVIFGAGRSISASPSYNDRAI